MKKILSIFVMLLATVSTFAQDYGEFSVKHSSSQDELQQYVGQHVQVFKYNGYTGMYAKEGHDEYIFKSKFGGVVGKTYKIEKIKAGKQIVFELSDESGAKIKAKVNANGSRDYKGMQSCKSFFLVDKFNESKQSQIGITFANSEGEVVGKSIDYIMDTAKDSYPKAFLIAQSELDGTKVKGTKEVLQKIFLPLGKILSNHKVKAQFKVVGIKDVLSSVVIYNVQNTENPSIVRSGSITNPEATIFKEDLSGHYISALSKVEKPSNAAIRYGKTTTIEDKNITKYSYIDNVIDILIFGGSKQFDFVLKNISDNSIKVVWNEAVFVDFDGTTSKIMHAGTKYSQREGDQPATTIIKGAKIEDLAAPNCNIRYSDTLKEWVTESMYPKDPALSPGQLKLMLPIQIKDVINEYVFIFDVSYVYNHPERLNL